MGFVKDKTVIITGGDEQYYLMVLAVLSDTELLRLMRKKVRIW